MARCAGTARVQRAERFCLHHLLSLWCTQFPKLESHTNTLHERIPPLNAAVPAQRASMNWLGLLTVAVGVLCYRLGLQWARIPMFGLATNNIAALHDSYEFTGFFLQVRNMEPR
jgi:hypothetical protein